MEAQEEGAGGEMGPSEGLPIWVLAGRGGQERVRSDIPDQVGSQGWGLRRGWIFQVSLGSLGRRLQFG